MTSVVGSVTRALLVAVALLAGCGTGPLPGASPTGPTAAGNARSPLSPPVHLKVAYINSSSEAALFIAVEKGYFKNEGLDVELIEMRQASDQVLALTTDQLDVGDSGASPLLFNAMERGVDIRITGYYGLVSSSSAGLAVVVRRDLMDSGAYTGPTDLKGLTVGVNDTTGTQLMYLTNALARGGLTPSDVDTVKIGYSDMIVALTNRKIDVALEIQPFALQMEQGGLGKTVMTSGELLPGAPTLVLMYGPRLVRQPEAARRFMVGFLRGQRDLWRAFDKGDGNKPEVYQILAKYTALKDPALNEAIASAGVLSGTLPNGEMPLDVVNQMQDFYLKTGDQKTRLDLEKFVDRAYAEYAVQRLGKAD